MAQRPRQTRIQFQSQFRPTSVDTMAADAMRQLAGLGRTMGQVTEQVARPIIEQKRAEEGREEAQKALEEGREVKKISPIKWGAEQYQAAASSTYKAGAMRNIDDSVMDIAKKHSGDIERYQNESEAYIKGLVAKAPPGVQDSLLEYHSRVSGKAQAEILKDIQAKELDASKAAYTEQEARFESQYLTLMQDGNLEGAAALLKDFNEKILPDFVASGATTLEDDAEFKLKLEDAAKTAQLNGVAQRIIESDKPIEQKIAEGEAFIESIEEADIAEFTPEEKQKAVDDLKKTFEDAEKQYETELKESKIASLTVQYENINTFDTDVMSSQTMTVKEKIVQLNELEYKGLIPEEEAASRRRYLNSLDKITATTKPPIYDALIQKTYDALSLADPEDRLNAFNQIRNEMFNSAAIGDIQEQDALAFEKQFINLTQSSLAKSSAELMDTYFEASDVIEAMLPVSQHGAAMRYLFFNVEPQIQAENEKRAAGRERFNETGKWNEDAKPDMGSNEMALMYKKGILEGIQQIRSNMVFKSRNFMKNQLPNVSTQAEYDALPPGAEYISNGEILRKR